MNEQLQYIFNNINDWLKFAEAKHSGLIALSSAILLATPAILKRPKKVLWRIIFILPAILFGVTIYISLSSFSPVLEKVSNPKEVIETENHYFFDEISKMDNAAFKRSISDSTNYIFTHLEDDLIDQIIINSRITSLKMKSFKKSLLYFKIGLGLLALLFVGRYIFDKHDF